MDYTKSGILIREGLNPKREKIPKDDLNPLSSSNQATTTSSISNSHSPEIFGKVLLEYAETELMNISNEWYNGTENREDGLPNNGTFSTNGESEYVPYIDRPETYIVPVLFAIIFIIGVLGNGTLILIFLRHRTMRNVPNMWVHLHEAFL